jgi:hypothetical protein
MIHYIRFSNFYSFLDEQVISFVVDKRAPDTTAYVQSAFGPRLTRVLACFGANASGKTNVVKVVGFLRFLMCDSYKFPSREDIPYQQFSPQVSSRIESKLETVFEHEDTLYRYTVMLNPQRIVRELLEARPRGGTRFRYVIERRFDPNANEYSLRINQDVPLMSLNIRDKALESRGNASVVSIGAQAGDELCTQIQEYWRRTAHNVNWMGRQHASERQRLRKAIQYFHSNPGSLKRAIHLLKKWDLGLADIRIREIEVPEKAEGENPLIAIVTHACAADMFSLPMEFESSGTQSLFIRLAELLPVLQEGGLAAQDELDADLHPHMTSTLVEMLLDSAAAADAQLLCTSHTATLMNHLDKYQILLVEKDAELRSELWRLDEMAGLRARDNYFAKYMAGTYGAIPDIVP